MIPHVRTDARVSSNVPAFEPLEPRLLLSATDGVHHLVLPTGSDSVAVQYVMPALKLDVVSEPGAARTVVRPVMTGAESIGEVGQPVLPAVAARIILPAGFTLRGVQVSAGDKVTLDGCYVVEEGKPAEALAAGLDFRDLSIYASSAPYPDAVFDAPQIQSRRGVRIVTVVLHPVAYVPSQGVLSYFNSLTLNVSLVPEAAPAGGVSAVRYRPDTIRPLAGEVDNPGALAGYEFAETSGPVTLGFCSPADSYQYVIVAPAAFAQASTDYTIGDFLARKQADGFTATLVTLESVLAGYTGVDNPEKLRNFVLDAYNNWETDYVLLAGDTGVMPWRGLWCSIDGETDNLPSDLYFQCLDGTFNDDHDGNWGEPTDGVNGGDVDLLAEVYVGRVAAETPAEMANWVYKALAYESDSGSPHRWTASMVGEHLGFGGVSEYATASMEEIRLGSDVAGFHTEGFAAFPDLTVDTLYDSPTFEWPESQLVSRMNSDTYGIFNHLGHANTSYVMKLYNADVDALTNDRFFFVYSQGCYPGDLPNDCIAEHFTTSTRHGAYAVVFNSRYGWGERESTDGGSQRPNREFWDALFGESINRLGPMNADSHEDNIWCINTGTVRWCVYETNLFGDPAVEILPVSLTVASPADLPQAYLDEPYQYSLLARGGAIPYRWSLVEGALPSGLHLDEDAGVISGSAAGIGASVFTVQVEDSTGAIASREIRLNATTRLVITTPSALPAAVANEPYRVALQAQGGAPPYAWSMVGAGQYEESDPGSGFVPGGAAMNWHADDAIWTLALPWAFPFYGVDYTSVNVSSNGFLDFTVSDSDYLNSAAELISSTRIAVLWDDLCTDGAGEDIFVDTSDPDAVCVHWLGETYSGANPVDCEAVLFRDGRIRFNYGQAHAGLTATIGISGGDGAHYTLSSRDGADAIPADASSLFAPATVLPPGLALDDATGEIAGAPTAVGHYAFACRIRDAGTQAQVATASFTLDILSLPPLTVTLPDEAEEGDGLLAGAGRVSIPQALGTNLTVSLVSLDAGELAVPATVTIPAGLTWAPFDVTVVDDAELDGTRTASVAASALGFVPSTDSLAVNDNESATLSVTLPAGAAEGDGLLVAAGTVTVSRAVDADVTVDLWSGDPTEATVGASVTIPAHLTSAPFNLTIVDDAELDGPRVVVITARVRNWTDGSAGMTVADNETLTLSLTLPSGVWEGEGVLTDAGRVSIPGILAADLVVSLAAGSPEIAVPASVTIPAGEASATFDVTVNDDGAIDGTQSASVTAGATGFTGAAASVAVKDNEVHHFAFKRFAGDAYVETPDAGATGGGVAMNWHGDDRIWELVLPWTFTFYGTGYSSVWVCSNGFLDFTEVTADYTNSTAELLGAVRIAVLWDDLRTDQAGEDIYVDTSDPDAVGIRWVAETYATGAPVDMQVTLRREGGLRFDYGAAHEGLSPTIGISKGDGVAYTLSVRDEATDLPANVGSDFSDASAAHIVGAPFPVVIWARNVGDERIASWAGSPALSASGAHGPVDASPFSATFAGGEWNSDVTVFDTDTGVTLNVDDGAGHSGTSEPFDVVSGVLDHFAWATVPSQQAGCPFAVTLTAVNAQGFTMTDFSGAVTLSAATGPGTVSVGSGSESWNYPFATYWHDCRTQVLYLADEIGVAGRITSLALDVVTPPGQTLNQWTIRMKHTSLDSYASPSWESSGWTVVYQANEDVSGVGWTTFAFTTPFDYDGVSNLMVDFSYNNSSWSDDGYCAATDTGAIRTVYYYTDSGYDDPLAWAGTSPYPLVDSYVPNIRLQIGVSVPVLPTTSGTFVNGVWSGPVILPQRTAGVCLIAADVLGHSGTSNTFNVCRRCDANEDTRVDGGDLAIWQQHYDPLGRNPGNCVAWGDWNGDGRINGADLALWQQNYSPLWSPGAEDEQAVKTETSGGEDIVIDDSAGAVELATDLVIGDPEGAVELATDLVIDNPIGKVELTRAGVTNNPADVTTARPRLGSTPLGAAQTLRMNPYDDETVVVTSRDPNDICIAEVSCDPEGISVPETQKSPVSIALFASSVSAKGFRAAKVLPPVPAIFDDLAPCPTVLLLS